MGEFELIQRFFQHRHPPVAQIPLGNGDDACLLRPDPGQSLAVSTDMLVEGRHFLSTVDPAALGHKALAVNLSDLAAMGARPLAFTLALSLPQARPDWLEALAQGMLQLADQHHCVLTGGDTTAGPLNLCITVFGQVPPEQALRRSRACSGDDVYVSGQLGEARLALEILRGHPDAPAASLPQVRARLERPTPRVALGMALRGVAHAAADLSDGLLGDLQHILVASGLRAQLDLDALLDGPAVSPLIRSLPLPLRLSCALAGGDDYELVFTAPPEARAAVEQAARDSHTPVTRIGQLRALTTGQPPRTQLCDRHGDAWPLPPGTTLQGHDHFA